MISLSACLAPSPSAETLAALNLAMCGAMGWTRKDESYTHMGEPCRRIVWYNPKGEPQALGDDGIPRYLGAPESLGLIREALQTLTPEQRDEYVYALADRTAFTWEILTASDLLLVAVFLQVVKPEIFEP